MPHGLDYDFIADSTRSNEDESHRREEGEKQNAEEGGVQIKHHLREEEEDGWMHRRKRKIKTCRGGEAETGSHRRIKWRGAYDGLAGLQRLPAAIQLLLKATSKSPLAVPEVQRGKQRA